MKNQVKKYVGWVAKGEKLENTIKLSHIQVPELIDRFGMFDRKGNTCEIKRTITITWEDEDGSTKTRKAKKKGKKKGKKKVIASPIVNKKSR